MPSWSLKKGDILDVEIDLPGRSVLQLRSSEPEPNPVLNSINVIVEGPGSSNQLPVCNCTEPTDLPGIVDVPLLSGHYRLRATLPANYDTDFSATISPHSEQS